MNAMETEGDRPLQEQTQDRGEDERTEVTVEPMPAEKRDRRRTVITVICVVVVLAVIGAGIAIGVILSNQSGELATITDASGAKFSWFKKSGWDFALNGADVVEYFSLPSSANAVAGSNDFQSEHFGVKWRFKNAENKKLFDANPSRFAPKYGAHCAYAMSQNYIASGDPDAWTVRGDKLYINFSKGVRSSWLSGGVDNLISKGDQNWSRKRKEQNLSNPH